MNSILARAVERIKAHPGESATQVANAIGEKRGTVSARLYEQYKKGKLDRRLGQGPQGGFGYRVAKGKSALERVMAHVKAHPGRFALQIAVGLGEAVRIVSGHLAEQEEQGKLRSEPGIGLNGECGYFIAKKPKLDKVLIGFLQSAATYEDRASYRMNERTNRTFEGATRMRLSWEDPKTGKTGEEEFIVVHGDRLKALEAEMAAVGAEWFK